MRRSVSGVLGFSRETLIGVITNIEGREFHRWKQFTTNQPLEHPRASSTDDVECFFSMMRDIGQKKLIVGIVYAVFAVDCSLAYSLLIHSNAVALWHKIDNGAT